MITCFDAEEEVTLVNVTSGPTPKFDPQSASSPEVAEVEEQLAVVEVDGVEVDAVCSCHCHCNIDACNACKRTGESCVAYPSTSADCTNYCPGLAGMYCTVYGDAAGNNTSTSMVPNDWDNDASTAAEVDVLETASNSQSCTQQITFYTQGTGCSGSAQSYANHNCGDCDTGNGQTYSCDGSTATTIDWATLDCHGAILHTYTHSLNQCTGWNSDVDAMITCFGAEDAAMAGNVTLGPTPKFDPKFSTSAVVV
jgi:hypothetical protein